MKYRLALAVLVWCSSARAASMTGHLHLAGEGKTFPEGTKVSVYHEASKARGEASVDGAGNFTVEGLEAGEKIRLTLPMDYEITTVSLPFVADAEQIARNPMSPTVMGPAAPEVTIDVIWKDRQTKWAEMRRKMVRTVSEGFFKEAKLTPEQQELYVTLRVESETRVMQEVHAHPGSTLLPGALMKDFYAALQKNFGDTMAQRYQEYSEDQIGWMFMQGSTTLKANDWLTGEEQVRLVRAWGPIMYASMDRSFPPKFETASREEKLAFYDEVNAAFASAARGILDEAKQAKLQECLAGMRRQAVAELDKEKAAK